MSDPLKKDFEYFLEHRQELLAQYAGKVLVIKDGTVHGAYKSEREAVNEGMKKFELGTFLVQLCSGEKDSYTRTFRSRVSFAA